MRTFAEMLPTANAEMREFVEAFRVECIAWKRGYVDPLEIMRATPPAKEPESADARIVEYSDGSKQARIIGQTAMEAGCRVRVTRLED